MMSTMDLNFTDVVVKESEGQYTISYRTGMAVYEETLYGGQYMSLGWNAAGYLSSVITLHEIPCLKREKFAEPQAFQLEMDGQSLGSHWEWAGYEQNKDDAGLHVAIKLKHSIREVAVVIHTQLDGTPILTRWLEVTNTGSASSALSTVQTWSGGMQSIKQWRTYVKEGSPLYSIGYMEDSRWGNEGSFKWHPLPNAVYGFNGGHRHRHPMFILRNEATGEHFIGQMAWAGGYHFTFELNADPGTNAAPGHDMEAHLSFKAGPSAPAPLRIIEAGRSVLSPEIHLGMLFGGLDDCVNAMHDHVRKSVMTVPQVHGRGNWIESGIGPELRMTKEMVERQIDVAAELGVEVFFIDAGWYTPQNGETDWFYKVGDWKVSTDRYPGGIGPIRDKVHEKGMLFGLWMEPERIGEKSRIYEEHPEWVASPYNGKDGRFQMGGMLDLGNPEVAEWFEEQICRVIEDNQLDFFRLDYNVGDIKAGGQTLRDGYIENNYWRYYEHFDGIFDRLRSKYPGVIFENCSGGGGRTNISTVRRFSHTWVTDWQVAPRSFSITNGMTMALPPEYIDRLIAGQIGHVAADIDFQARQLLFVRPTVGVFQPLGVDTNPVQLAHVRHMLDIYKTFVRPFMSEGKIYHHTPEMDGFEPRGWGVLELASKDGTRAIAGVFQLANPQEREYTLRMRGLDRSRTYRVTWDNHRQTAAVEGYSLMNQGLIIRLEGALTSELLLFEALEQE